MKAHEWKFAVLSSNLSLTYDVMVSIQPQDKETFEKYRDVLPFFGNVLREGRIIGTE